MNKKFEEFVSEIKERLLSYEMDESCFDDYDDNDRQMMRRLRQVLYPSKQQVYMFKDCEEFKKCNERMMSMEGGRKYARAKDE